MNHTVRRLALGLTVAALGCNGKTGETGSSAGRFVPDGHYRAAIPSATSNPIASLVVESTLGTQGVRITLTNLGNRPLQAALVDAWTLTLRYKPLATGSLKMDQRSVLWPRKEEGRSVQLPISGTLSGQLSAVWPFSASRSAPGYYVCRLRYDDGSANKIGGKGYKASKVGVVDSNPYVVFVHDGRAEVVFVG